MWEYDNVAGTLFQYWMQKPKAKLPPQNTLECYSFSHQSSYLKCILNYFQSKVLRDQKNNIRNEKKCLIALIWH